MMIMAQKEGHACHSTFGIYGSNCSEALARKRSASYLACPDRLGVHAAFRKLVFMSFRLLAQELEWQEHELQEIVCAPSRFADALAGRDGSPVVTEDAV
jgi:hypothetical protein